jgi:hypothetical protein
MLLTISNIGNYCLGNKISPFFIISFVILSYLVIFKKYFENILNNTMLSYSLLILLILDVGCIIYLYFSKYKNIKHDKDIKQDKDIKHKDKKHKHKDKKDKDKKDKDKNKDKKNKDIEIQKDNVSKNNTIKTYKTDNIGSIKTYNTL